jgi:hypothetical protein
MRGSESRGKGNWGCSPSRKHNRACRGLPASSSNWKRGRHVDLDLTIPQESGGQMDIEMTGATSGVGHNQVLQGLDGGVHRVHTIFLVGNGADDED